MEQTLSIIKPDAVRKNQIGNILARFEKDNLKIVAMKMVHLKKEEAKRFYSVHIDKPFYNDLTSFLSEGPIVALVLEGSGAIEKNRTLMGNTNPEKADPGTIRKDFATNIERNAVHGSDSLQSAAIEIPFFFTDIEIYSC